MTKFDEIPLIAKLLTAGTSACVADTVTFPLDTAKVRLQIQGEGSGKSKSHFRYKGVFSTIATISKEEGPRSLYNGLSAGLQRQMCFASIRFGMYDTVKRFYQRMVEDPNKKSGSGVELLIRICAGITTGCLAVVVAQPTDIVKVRFQAQSGKNRKYNSTLSAYRGLYNQEGIPGLWKGMFPNMARNAIVNVSEIVCYDIVKDAILHNKLMEDNIYCHFTSAVIAGFCTTLLSSPVDVIKTRYMNSPKGMYKSALDCAIRSIKEEGPTSMYKGFMPSFYRLVAWNIVMWITYEKLKRLVPLLFSDNKK